jgi:hypothetical protein
MNTHPMRALVWKDYRLVRALLLWGVGLILLFYIPPFLREVWAYSRHKPQEWPVAISLALCFLTSGLLAAMSGASLSASERADRSAGFIAFLPFSRRAKVASKAIVGLLALSTVVVLDAGVFEGIPSLSEPETESAVLCSWVLVFCGAWLAGWMLASPAIASTIGMGMPIILGTALFLADTQKWYSLWALALGAGFFLLGCVIALARRD